MFGGQGSKKSIIDNSNKYASVSTTKANSLPFRMLPREHPSYLKIDRFKEKVVNETVHPLLKIQVDYPLPTKAIQTKVPYL